MTVVPAFTVREKAMNSFSFTKDQARQLAEALFAPTNNLVRLRNRMHERGFPHDDPLYVLVCDAYERMQQLSMHVHYLSCDGVGRPSRRPDDERSG
jgi:hypothetical protein